MIGAKEVMDVMRTNPSFQDEVETDEEAMLSVQDNHRRMRDLGIDLDDVAEGTQGAVLFSFAVAVRMANLPSAVMSIFIAGIQVGFCLGRGYVEDE